jgi:carboxymethylenebutenolidase
MSYEGQIAETISIVGHGGDRIEAYFARPIATADGQSVPGVVVFHHAPGWDEWTKEVVRRLAHHGYAAICPHLFSRSGPGNFDDVAAAARAAGGVSDARAIGDGRAGVEYLRSLPYANGKVGTIGFCMGGRLAYIAACQIEGLDAAVDCWGGRVIAAPEDLNEKRPVNPIDLTPRMVCPLLGIFGNDDANPDVEQVNRTETELKRHGKTYEFHRYDGAGHGFFCWERPNYRQAQAVDGWQQVWGFFGRYLAT